MKKISTHPSWRRITIRSILILLVCTIWIFSILFLGQKAIPEWKNSLTPQVLKEQRTASGVVSYIEGETNTFRYWGFHPHTYTINLYRRDDSKRPYQTFRALRDDLLIQGQKLFFATNAGIYGTGLQPEGLHLEYSHIIHPLNTKTGDGNFYLSPNGIFFLTYDNTPAIYETNGFDLFRAKRKKELRLAGQSGPLLVYRNTIHPLVNPGSPNTFIRSGIGIGEDGLIYFVLSKTNVNFYALANFFKTQLHCPDALYLDGAISSVYTDKKGSEQGNQIFVGMFGVTQKF